MVYLKRSRKCRSFGEVTIRVGVDRVDSDGSSARRIGWPAVDGNVARTVKYFFESHAYVLSVGRLDVVLVLFFYKIINIRDSIFISVQF